MDYWSRTHVRLGHITKNVDYPVYYKLTNSTDQSFSATQWGEGCTHYAPGATYGVNGQLVDDYPPLCSNRWLHAYHHPVIAVLLNRVHGDFDNPHLWVCTGKAKVLSLDMKVGCTHLKTEYKIPTPIISNVTRMRWAIACVSKTYDDDVWRTWANNWSKDYERNDEVAMKTAKHCSSEVLKVRNVWGNMNSLSWAAWAAHWAALASVAVSVSDERRQRMFENMVAQAALYAAVAGSFCNRSVGLVRCAEEVMAV